MLCLIRKVALLATVIQLLAFGYGDGMTKKSYEIKGKVPDYLPIPGVKYYSYTFSSDVLGLTVEGWLAISLYYGKEGHPRLQVAKPLGATDQVKAGHFHVIHVALDSVELNQYFTKSVLAKCYRLLKDGGRLNFFYDPGNLLQGTPFEWCPVKKIVDGGWDTWIITKVESNPKIKKLTTVKKTPPKVVKIGNKNPNTTNNSLVPFDNSDVTTNNTTVPFNNVQSLNNAQPVMTLIDGLLPSMIHPPKNNTTTITMPVKIDNGTKITSSDNSKIMVSPSLDNSTSLTLNCNIYNIFLNQIPDAQSLQSFMTSVNQQNFSVLSNVTNPKQ